MSVFDEPALAPERVAALRRPFRRWVRILAGLVSLAAVFAYDIVVVGVDRIGFDALALAALPLIAMVLALRPLGYSLWWALGMSFCPVVAWWLWFALGYRFSQLPLRDWEPHPKDNPRVRHVPGTPYHVVLSRRALREEQAVTTG